MIRTLKERTTTDSTSDPTSNSNVAVTDQRQLQDLWWVGRSCRACPYRDVALAWMHDFFLEQGQVSLDLSLSQSMEHAQVWYRQLSCLASLSSFSFYCSFLIKNPKGVPKGVMSTSLTKIGVKLVQNRDLKWWPTFTKLINPLVASCVKQERGGSP